MDWITECEAEAVAVEPIGRLHKEFHYRVTMDASIFVLRRATDGEWLPPEVYNCGPGKLTAVIALLIVQLKDQLQ